MKDFSFGIDVQWQTPYWYDSFRSWAYGGHYYREPTTTYTVLSGHLLGLSLSAWYSR
jgi:hypothetical protein